MEMNSEYIHCLSTVGYSFLIAAALIEFSKDRVGKWIGRFGVLCCLFLLASFGKFATEQCQVLQAKKYERQATQIAGAADDHERTVTTPDGNTLTWVSLRTIAGNRTLSRAGSGTGRCDSGQGGNGSSEGCSDSCGRCGSSGGAGESGSADSLFGSTALKNRL